MSAGLIGALVGLVIAVAQLFALRQLASRVDLAETKRVLKVSGRLQLVLLPVLGWIVGSQFAGE